jgi:hypothetical protein
MRAMKMFRVYFTNFCYFAEPAFDTLEDAIAYAKSKTFDATIYGGRHIIGAWSYFGGYRNLV